VPAHTYTGEWEYFVGGGVAVFDCTGDGLPEVFAAGGAGPSTLFHNQSTQDEVAFSAFPMPKTGLDVTSTVTGTYPIDLDNDGILDLVVMKLGQNQLYKGLGDCQFAAFEGNIGIAFADTWTTAFTATWEAGQSLPTLAFGNYVDRFDPEGPFETCDASYLYRPEGDGYSTALPLDPGFCTLSMLFSDWGRTGQADLRVSNDRHYYVRGGSEQLWAMDSTPRLYTDDDGWEDHSLWGMGIASRDITGDGLPEIYLTSMGDQKLHSLADPDKPTYENAPYSKGITAHRPYTGGDGRPSTGWHVAFGDVQNDGWDDIFVTKGNVEQMPVAAMQDPNNLMIAVGDGTFTEQGDVAGIASMARSRGGALVDLNADGLLDIVVNNRRAPLEVYQNTTASTGSWITVDLRQDGANSFAIGAQIEVRAQDRVWTQERTIGGGHAGGSHSPLHFGLGPLTDPVEVTVIWPDQTRSVFDAVALNRQTTLTK